jgi:hypothetical protein
MFLSVGNLAHAHFVSQFFDIPLQGGHDDGVPGAYTDRELYDAFAHLFGYVFLDLDPGQTFKNRTVAKRDAQRMGRLIGGVVAEVKSRRFTSVKHMLGIDGRRPALADYGTRLVSRMLGQGNDTDEVVWTIIPTAAAACATQAQGVSFFFLLPLLQVYDFDSSANFESGGSGRN